MGKEERCCQEGSKGGFADQLSKDYDSAFKANLKADARGERAQQDVPTLILPL